MPKTQNLDPEVNKQLNGSDMETNIHKHLDEEKAMKCVKIRLDFLPFSQKPKSHKSEPEIDMDDTNSINSNSSSQMEKLAAKPIISHEQKICHKCDLCFKTFSEKAKLKFHLIKVHKMGNLKIDLLKKNEKNDETFNNLVIGEHVCDICKETFKNLHELNLHKEIKHEENAADSESNLNNLETVKSEVMGNQSDVEQNPQKEMQNLTEEELVSKVEKVIMDDSKDNDGKLDLPNLVYLHAGIEKRLPIEKHHYEEFIEFLQDKLFEQQSEEIEISWYGYGLSRGIIGCRDGSTAKFVMEAVSNFNVIEGQRFRGWLKNEHGCLPKKDVFTGFLDGKYWQGKNPKESLSLIFKRNKIEEKFNLIEYENSSNGVQITFETNGNVTEAIKQKCNVLNAGLSKLKLEYNKE